MKNIYFLIRPSYQRIAFLVLCILMVTVPGVISAQSGKQQIKGQVLDGQGDALIGVAVRNLMTSTGVITDIDGFYAIEAQKGEILEFSYVGYNTVKKEVANSSSISIVMTEDVQSLDEVVVVGMGTQRKASVIGSIASVRMADLKVPSRSLENALVGRMAGIIGVQRSGEPGQDDSSFWIRGISTFGANQDPLVLVDGVERSMTNISPEEIESVSILKDASATAVYGVRAANGVVLVTTRKGEASEKPSIELKMEYGVSQLTRMPKLLDGANFMELYNEANGTPIYSDAVIEATRLGTDPYLYPNVDWFNEIFKKNSDNSNISLNVHGGGKVARYFVSVGIMNEHGNYRDNPTNSYKSNISLTKYNYRANVDVSLSKSTTLDLELGGWLIDSHNTGMTSSELFDKAYTQNPINIPVRYPYGFNADGSQHYVWAGSNSITTENPAERLMGSGYRTEFKNQFNGQARLSQDFGKWVPGLKANVAFSFDAYTKNITKRTKKESYYMATGRDDAGNLELKQMSIGDEYLGYETEQEVNRAMELKAQVTYERVFNTVHRVGGMGMYYHRDYRDGTATEAIRSLPYRKQGLAARATYSYDDRYFAEFNIGYNGSENFPKGQRFGIFPAGAIGYLISNEKFWQNSSINNVVSMLKLKGSMGLVGAEALPNNRRYAYLTIVGDGLGGYIFGPNETNYAGTGENQYGVVNLTWEKGLKSNIGIQAEFFGGDVSLDVDYFYEKRKDILIQRNSLPGIAGINDMPFANLGRMENQGVDGTIEYNKSFRDFSMRVYANGTFTHNTVLDQDQPDYQNKYQNRVGKRHNQQFGLIALGYFNDEAEIARSPKQQFGTVRPGDVKYLDVNGDGIVDSNDEVAIGYSSIPEIVYGFGTQLMWKGFDVGIFFRGQTRVSYMLGGEGFVPFQEGGDRGNLFVEALDRWTVDNPRQDAFYPRLSIGGSTNNYQESTKWQVDGSFLRLADLEIGYSFPKKWLEPMFLSGLRIYFHGTNLAVFSPFKMWDPEIGKGRGDAYPLQRKYNFGLRVNF